MEKAGRRSSLYLVIISYFSICYLIVFARRTHMLMFNCLVLSRVLQLLLGYSSHSYCNELLGLTDYYTHRN